MRILHICQFLGVGGLEQVLYLMIREQIKQGHHVEVIVYDHDRRWVDKYKQLGIEVHIDYLKTDGFDIKLINYLAIKTNGFDIIHTHDLNPAIYLSVLKLKSFLKMKKINFIHTTHGMEHIDESPKTIIYEAFIGLMANRIITVSPKLQKYYQSQILTQKKKIALIDNGVNIPKTVLKISTDAIYQKLNLDKEKVTAIYVARIVPLKG